MDCIHQRSRHLIWAIILAAGESHRMGEPKLLLPFGQKTIFETVLANVLNSNADRICVVLGAREKELQEKIRDLSIKAIVNHNYKKGMLSSIQLGFLSLPEEAKAAVIVLGDQPSIPSTVIDSIIKVYRTTGKGIILPVHTGRRGHPILIDTKYRNNIAGLDPDIGLKELIHSHREDIVEVKVDTPAILKDIDTPEDYKRETST